jgi:uncharacterized protein YkwD
LPLRAVAPTSVLIVAISFVALALGRPTAFASSTGACPYAQTPATSASLHAMDAAVACLVNEQRIRHGLPALRVSWRLTTSAQRWTNRMVATRDYSHGSNFAGRIRAVGYNLLSAGEDIDTGMPTPSQVVAAWLHSTPHCQNILYPAFRDIGVGESPASVFGPLGPSATWTLDFGLTRSERPLSTNARPADGCPYGMAS